MAFREYDWPAANVSTQVIALSQSVTTPGGLTQVPLVLNGSYSQGPAYNQNIPGQYVPILLSSSSNVVHQLQNAPAQYVVPFPGFFRTIRISSSTDLSALTFHVIGTYAGMARTEDITGPNATTADSVNFYDNIQSITVSGAAATYTDVNVGLGLTGGLSWFNFDWRQELSAMTIQVVVAGLINYTFGVTIQDVTILPFSSLFLVDPTRNLTNQGVNGFGNTSILPFKWCTIYITTGEGGTDATGALHAYFLQGGI